MLLMQGQRKSVKIGEPMEEERDEGMNGVG